MRFKDYSGTEQFRPLSAWAYFGYAILFAIPIIGWICLLIFTFSTKNYNRRSYARSYWCGFLVALIITGIILATGVGAGWLYEYVPALREWVPDTSGRTSTTASSTVQPTRNESNVATDGVTPEFKETMDEYEAFFDSYIEFMEGYDESNATITQLSKYTKMMAQYSETMEALDRIEESTMTEADDQYYTKVMLRINQKLASFAAAQ